MKKLILIILLAAGSLAHANTQAELNELINRQRQGGPAEERQLSPDRVPAHLAETPRLAGCRRLSLQTLPEDRRGSSMRVSSFTLALWVAHSKCKLAELPTNPQE